MLPPTSVPAGLLNREYQRLLDGADGKDETVKMSSLDILPPAPPPAVVVAEHGDFIAQGPDSDLEPLPVPVESPSGPAPASPEHVVAERDESGVVVGGDSDAEDPDWPAEYLGNR